MPPGRVYCHRERDHPDPFTLEPSRRVRMFHKSSLSMVLRGSLLIAALAIPTASVTFAADKTVEQSTTLAGNHDVIPYVYSANPTPGVESSGPLPYPIAVAARPIFGGPTHTSEQTRALTPQVSQLTGPYDGPNAVVPMSDLY
jgi:hypothetical protein